MKVEKDMKKEIIISYENLIENCEKAIEKGVDIDKNKMLLSTYSDNLIKVKRKPKNAYDDVLKEMDRIRDEMPKIFFQLNGKYC